MKDLLQSSIGNTRRTISDTAHGSTEINADDEFGVVWVDIRRGGECHWRGGSGGAGRRGLGDGRGKSTWWRLLVLWISLWMETIRKKRSRTMYAAKCGARRLWRERR